MVNQAIYQEFTQQDILWITNSKIFTLFLPDRIDEELIKEKNKTKNTLYDENNLKVRNFKVFNGVDKS